MRLFAAVLPPPPVVAELDAAVGELRGAPDADQWRWTAPAGWHVTLAFYGEVEDRLAGALGDRLARAASRYAPYELRLAGGGRFGDRALWAGVEGDTTTTRHLADTATAAGRRIGLVCPEHRAYRPHLTLALRRAAGRELAPYVAQLAGFASSPWWVEELRLLRSDLPSGGVPGELPRYTTLASWPLRG